MTTVSFDFADTYTVETRDVEMDVPVTELPTEMQAKIFGYGFSVFTDAANGAPRAAAVDALGDKKDKETADAYNKRLAAWYKDTTNAPAILAKTEELMEKRLNNVLKGLWSIRGAGMSRRDRVLDTIVRASAKAVLSEADWKRFGELADDEQDAKVRGWYEGNREAFDAAVDKRIAELDAQRAERKGLHGAVKISL